MFLIFLIFLEVLSVCLSAYLPSSFIKCDRNQKDFQECMPKAATHAMSIMTKPFKEIGLPSIDPLLVESTTISAGTKTVGFEQTFKNYTIRGISKGKCSKMDTDLIHHKIIGICFMPEILIEGDYELNGKLLLLDIYGKGKGSIKMDKVAVSLNFSLEHYFKKSDGLKYGRLLKTDVDLEPEFVSFHYENLFDGNKLLAENVDKVLNENWKAVFEDIHQQFNEAFVVIINHIFGGFLDKLTVEEMFGKEQ